MTVETPQKTPLPFGTQPEDLDSKYSHTHRSGPVNTPSEQGMSTKPPSNPFSAAANLLDPDYRSPVDIYLADPVAFAHDMFLWEDGRNLTVYQEEILSLIPQYKRVSVRGPHGLGKTGLAAIAVLWFALTRDAARRDWKIPTTASTWRQLESYLWPEIRKWARLLNWEKVGRQPFIPNIEMLHLSLKLRFGTAFAAASDIPENIEGAHADEIFYLMDESKTIKSETFDAIEGALSGGEGTNAFALSISTPGPPTGRFFEIQTRKPGTEDWKVRAVTLQEAIDAGRVSREWADQRGRQWGFDSPIYRNRVLGEFASDAKDGVIPTAWIELAMQRSKVAADGAESGEEGETSIPSRSPVEVFVDLSTPLNAKEWCPFNNIALDVSGEGKDKSVFAVREGLKCKPLITMPVGVDTMGLTGRAMSFYRANQSRGYVTVDTIGIGAGIVSRLREQGVDTEAFNAAAMTDFTDPSGELVFLNKRASAWWGMRHFLDPANGYNVELPDDDELLGDLSTPRYSETSAGKIVIEDKKSIRKRIGRSTDKGDAVVMLFADREPTGEESMMVWDEPVTISPY